MNHKPINGFENYIIGENAEVINTITGNVIKQIYNPVTKYMQINLRKNKRTHTKVVHRLVAETHLPKGEGYLEVNHKDGDKLNNRLNNLEWVTRSENIKHAIRNGLISIDSMKERGIKGGINAKEKLGYKFSLINIYTGEIKKFNSKREAEKELGICRKQLSLVLNDENGKRRVGSYKKFL